MSEQGLGGSGSARAPSSRTLTRSKSKPDTQRSEVTAGVTGLEGAVNTQGLFVLELKAMILPSRCGYPCMRMLMKRTWVCERISSALSVDFPEHPEP